MKKAFSDITILIDIDDTIEDLLTAWCKWLNDLYGLNVKPDEVTDWDVARFFPTLTKEQVFEPLHTDHFWKTVEPKDEAVKYVKQLIDDGFNVYLCTTTDYRNVKPKYEYIILKHFPFISWRQVIVAGRKQMIKADFLMEFTITRAVTISKSLCLLRTIGGMMQRQMVWLEVKTGNSPMIPLSALQRRLSELSK